MPIHPRDWHLLGCRVYINTFGVASASYYWSRVSSALSADCLNTSPQTAPIRGIWWRPTTTTWKQEENTVASRCSLSFSSAARVGCHFPGTRRQVARQLSGWNSNCCTAPTTWAFHSDVQSVSQSGPERWLIQIRSTWGGLRKASGASCLSWGALELERPFLGPLYRLMSLHPRSSVRRVPPYVRFFLRCLAERVSGSRHYNCAVSMESTTVASRVDAQASSERTGIGGWFPQRTGRQDRCQEVAMVLAGTERGRLALGLFTGSKTSARHLDSRSTRRVSRTETTVRGDLRGETREFR